MRGWPAIVLVSSVALVSSIALVSARDLPHSAAVRRLLTHNDEYLVGCNDLTYENSQHSFTTWPQPNANTFVIPSSELDRKIGTSNNCDPQLAWCDLSKPALENCARFCASEVQCNTFVLYATESMTTPHCILYNTAASWYENNEFTTPKEAVDGWFLFDFHRLEACATVGPSTTTTNLAPTTTPAPATPPTLPTSRPCGAGLYWDDGSGGSGSAVMRRLLEHNSAYELAACNEISDSTHTSTYTSYFYPGSQAWYRPKNDFIIPGETNTFYESGNTFEWYNSTLSFTENCALRCASFPTCNIFWVSEKHDASQAVCYLYAAPADWITQSPTTNMEKYYWDQVGQTDLDEDFVYVLEHSRTCVTSQVVGSCQLCPNNTYSTTFDVVGSSGCTACPAGHTTPSGVPATSADNCTAPASSTPAPAPSTASIDAGFRALFGEAAAADGCITEAEWRERFAAWCALNPGKCGPGAR